MKYYSSFGFNNFILALGYKASYIKEYFYNYRITQNDYTLDFNPKTSPEFHNLSENNNWKISFIDTGLETLKGARIKELKTILKLQIST